MASWFGYFFRCQKAEDAMWIVDLARVSASASLFYWLSAFPVGDAEAFLSPGIGSSLALYALVGVYHLCAQNR